MAVSSTIKFLTTHPLTQNNKFKTISRFLKWQLNTRINSDPIIHAFTDKVKLIVKKGMTGATGNYYCGLHEFSDMGFVLHFLRETDLFLDVGANIGSYTLLASGHVGATTIAFEPSPLTYSHLLNNINLNGIYNKAEVQNVGIGSTEGELYFTNNLDTVNHIVPNRRDNATLVKVNTLDNILHHRNAPSLIKIDVEGFETEVLKGAVKTLTQSALKGVIIELNGSGKRYGYDEKAIHQSLLTAGFIPHSYEPFTRALTTAETFGSYNTIYLRDLPFVEERIKNAPKITILNQSF